MPINYIPVSQDGSVVEEKDGFQHTQRTHRPVRWSCGLLMLGTVLVASICANSFFIYRQFVKPWELLDELPTQFGGLSQHPTCSDQR